MNTRNPKKKKEVNAASEAKSLHALGAGMFFSVPLVFTHNPFREMCMG